MDSPTGAQGLRGWELTKDSVQCTFNLRSWIGGGGFGDVYRGTYLGAPVAVKLLRGSDVSLKEASSKDFLREVQGWLGLRFPNVLLLYGACTDPQAMFMVSPLMENGDLLNYLQNVRPDADRVLLLCDVARGMAYLESRGIVHADLKPGNVLVDKDGRAVIADFGLSKFEATSVSGSRPGTTMYMDPERLRLFMRDTSQRTRTPVSTMAGDIYSFGILCYVLLLMVSLQVWTKDGQPYGPIESVRDLMTDIVYEGKRPNVSDARLQDMPPALKGLMQRCWEGKSSARPKTFKEVLEVLETLLHSSASTVDTRLESLEHPPRLTNLRPPSTAGTVAGAAAAGEELGVATANTSTQDQHRDVVTSRGPLRSDKEAPTATILNAYPRAPPLRPNQYTVGWICALPIELAAATALLDEQHPTLERIAGDGNIYTFGRMGGHNVILACLPAGTPGGISAATVAAQLMRTFTSVEFGLMVGIGSGVPSEDADIRLGDVVVSMPFGTHGGVVQFDSGQLTSSGFHRTGHLDSPPRMLLNAVTHLQASQLVGKNNLTEHIAKLTRLRAFSRAATGKDVLFDTTCNHVPGVPTQRSCTPLPRQQRPDEEPFVHYGTIASGSRVMSDAVQRDAVSKELGGVLCFETEAAGLMSNFPCLVIRGVCDYADSHKNNKWQGYAAATAAACAKEILSVIQPEARRIS
ncbi:hypothetical protein HDU93_004277 [Gonapodya sp. JEL0774]|nr:hypothetical protein HDU93_004277 [Gonapodya sp. JEL0774]